MGVKGLSGWSWATLRLSKLVGFCAGVYCLVCGAVYYGGPGLRPGEGPYKLVPQDCVTLLDTNLKWSKMSNQPRYAFEA